MVVTVDKVFKTFIVRTASHTHIYPLFSYYCFRKYRSWMLGSVEANPVTYVLTIIFQFYLERNKHHYSFVSGFYSLLYEFHFQLAESSQLCDVDFIVVLYLLVGLCLQISPCPFEIHLCQKHKNHCCCGIENVGEHHKIGMVRGQWWINWTNLYWRYHEKCSCFSGNKSLSRG